MVGNEGSTGNVRDLGSHTHTGILTGEVFLSLTHTNTHTGDLSLSHTQIFTREVLHTHILYADGATTKHH